MSCVIARRRRGDRPPGCRRRRDRRPRQRRLHPLLQRPRVQAERQRHQGAQIHTASSAGPNRGRSTGVQRRPQVHHRRDPQIVPAADRRVDRRRPPPG